MNRLQNKSLRMCSLGTMCLLALAAFGTSAKPALGQDTVQGKFTLPAEARLGKTVLSAGEYKFSVHTLGTIRSVNSIQTVNSQVLVVVWGTMKGGPVVSLVATALKQVDMPNANALDFRENGTGMMIHSIGLEKYKLVLAFNEYKTEGEMRARGPELAQGRTSAKGSE